MKQTATVVNHNGRLMAEVVRSEACQQCRACQFGQQEKVYVDLGNLSCREGDQVEIDLDDAKFSKASVIAYGIPVAFFFAALFLARAFTSLEYIQALAAIAGVGLGLICVRCIDRYIKAGGKYSPKVTISRRNGE